MGKRVSARIERQSVVFDFDGFEGNDCIAERDRLRRELARLGVQSSVRRRQDKRTSVTPRPSRPRHEL